MLMDQIKCRLCNETEYVQVHGEEYNNRVCYTCKDLLPEEPTYPVLSTEAGKVTVTSREQAEKMILSTCKALMIPLNDIPAFGPFKILADFFKIDLTLINQIKSTDPMELMYGYPVDYYFEEAHA